MAQVTDLETPAVTVLLDVVERNIRRVHEHLARHGIANRPHVKTHKIPALGRMQMAAGAVGITCQKLGEVEVFAEAGVADDVLLAFNVIGAAKIERLLAVSRRLRRLAVVFDNEVVARGLSQAARAAGTEIPFLLECDTGLGRNGVQTPAAALELVRTAMRMGGLRFEGLMTFPNQPGTRPFFERALDLFQRAGIAVPVVSGGGTPALFSAQSIPQLTEHRAGTYVYNDRMTVAAGAATWDDCAMRVRCTVVSRPAPDRAVLDAGSKVFTSDLYTVTGYGYLPAYPEAQVVRLSEEHGVVDLSGCGARPGVGEVVEVVPNHCCVVSNMVDEVYAVRRGTVETVWPVAARGAVR
jgi:D-serine deaminase-like pyridoxal phosphate-dependent protein